MGQQNSSLVTDNSSGKNCLQMTDINVELTDSINDHKTSLDLNLTELWVFGISGSAEGKRFPLLNNLPGRWKMKGYVELPLGVDGIDCVVKCDEGEDVGFVHLDVSEMRSSKIQHQSGFSQKMEISDGEGQLTISYGVVEIPSEDISAASDPQVAANLFNHGIDWMLRFQRTGELSDITEAISVLQKAVDTTPVGHVSLPSRLTNLGNSFMYRFQRTGDLVDVAQATSILQKAVELTTEEDAKLPGRLANLGSSLLCRFQRTSDPSDNADAIAALQKSVELTPEGASNLPGRLANLGNAFLFRFRQTAQLSDVSEAASAFQKAVTTTPTGHADLPTLLRNLGVSLDSCFKQTGELSVINNAVSAHGRAVELTPQGHADLPNRLSNLGASLNRRFERTGDPADADEAISVVQRAIELTPPGQNTPHTRLGSLGLLFMHRFDRSSDLSDIGKAIFYGQRATELTPQGHPGLPIQLSNLGNSFNARFERTGELSDAAEATSLLERAVEITPQDSSDLSSILNNLGNSFTLRFKRTGELSDIDEAISAQRRAVELTRDDDLPIQLCNLGLSLTLRFMQNDEVLNITEAIEKQQRAVELTPQDHPQLPVRLSNLGISLLRRFEAIGELSDVEEAITTLQKAVELTPRDHANLVHMLYNLGNVLTSRYGSSRNSGDLEKSISCHKKAAISTSGSPQIKLSAAQRWADLLIQHHPQSPEIVLSFNTVLSLVSLIAGLERTVRGRYTQLQNTSCLALKAAAAAYALDRADKALEWLEQGRCLVWSQLNNLRSPLDDLRVHNKSLAQRIEDVSRRLENAGSSRASSHTSMSLAEKRSLEDEARVHLDLARQWDELLSATRVIPGFESFLMPQPCSVIMQHLPESGPIVVINIDKRRCDAIALLAGLDEPLHIPLPNFSIEKASKYRTDLSSQLQSHQLRVREVDEEFLGRGVRPAPVGRRGGDPPVHQVLRGLWEEVVKPILNALGFSKATEAPGEILPRIWWCPTGPLSFLPLHAAGVYRGPNPESALDYIVSSYTPTVTAITSRVKDRRSIDTEGAGLFLTSQPNAAGVSAIPATTREVQSIFKRAKESGFRVLKLEGDEMSVKDCLEYMIDFSSIHLACHGSQNAAEPLQSRFLFHQGSLDLATILQANLRNADLAFLSACQTSAGEEKLSDEAVHLAAGMLAAGYRRVVASMWAIGDQAAQEVATEFYDYIFAKRKPDASDTVFDASLSAYALHYATDQLRRRLDDSERSLLSWVPFVHFGY
ncbi:CHAT domain-containing protein [Ephemerocybe angulata]|uniref:CHAT domain-containing protein n=1 Tax=Ephemerocybe angulata TaxID=980116 RepID=A0A8H6HIX5_9AGAR|nr:CHAT domain-containing protein [Tulosesus angulatus]